MKKEEAASEGDAECHDGGPKQVKRESDLRSSRGRNNRDAARATLRKSKAADAVVEGRARGDDGPGGTAGNTVFYHSAPENASDAELLKYFSRAGEVRALRAFREPSTGRRRGYGVCEYASAEAAAAAVSKLDGIVLGGQRGDRGRGGGRALRVRPQAEGAPSARKRRRADSPSLSPPPGLERSRASSKTSLLRAPPGLRRQSRVSSPKTQPARSAVAAQNEGPAGAAEAERGAVSHPGAMRSLYDWPWSKRTAVKASAGAATSATAEAHDVDMDGATSAVEREDEDHGDSQPQPARGDAKTSEAAPAPVCRVVVLKRRGAARARRRADDALTRTPPISPRRRADGALMRTPPPPPPGPPPPLEELVGGIPSSGQAGFARRPAPAQLRSEAERRRRQNIEYYYIGEGTRQAAKRKRDESMDATDSLDEDEVHDEDAEEEAAESEVGEDALDDYAEEDDVADDVEDEHEDADRFEDQADGDDLSEVEDDAAEEHVEHDDYPPERSGEGRRGRAVFFHNVPFNTSEETLRRLLGEAGRVLALRCYRTRTGLSRGQGLCYFATPSAAARALRLLPGRPLEDPAADGSAARALQLRLHTGPEEDARKGGGLRGRRGRGAPRGGSNLGRGRARGRGRGGTLGALQPRPGVAKLVRRSRLRSEWSGRGR